MSKLVVGGLPADITSESVKALFGSLAPIQNVTLGPATQGTEAPRLRSLIPLKIGSISAQLEVKNPNDATKCTHISLLFCIRSLPNRIY